MWRGAESRDLKVQVQGTTDEKFFSIRKFTIVQID